VPLVTIELAVKNGAMTEPPELLRAVAPLRAHVLQGERGPIPSQEAYLARVRELGMSFNGTTGTERVNYFFTTTSDHTKTTRWCSCATRS
jgi:zinc protease